MDDLMISRNPDINAFSQLLEIITTERKVEPPVDVEAIAKSIGIELKYEQMLCDGSVEEINQSNYLIKVNQNANRLRQRFTIAHELGHIILKKVDKQNIIRQLDKTFQNRKTFKFQEYDNERLSDILSSLLLIPLNVSKRFSNWETFSIKKSMRVAHKWQVSLNSFLWSTLAFAEYEGGFIWYKVDSNQEDPNNIELRYWWHKFPKSCKINIPETVFLRMADSNSLNYSLIDFSHNEEKFHPRVKFEFKGLSEYHAVRLKAFGKRNQKKVLLVVYPKEIKPAILQKRIHIQKTLL
jgi:Zn-dependent peptidase ImmA (M78 family)